LLCKQKGLKLVVFQRILLISLEAKNPTAFQKKQLTFHSNTSRWKNRHPVA